MATEEREIFLLFPIRTAKHLGNVDDDNNDVDDDHDSDVDVGNGDAPGYWQTIWIVIEKDPTIRLISLQPAPQLTHLRFPQ